MQDQSNKTFTILLHLEEVESFIDLERIVCDLNDAINEYGLLGGNFLVEETPDVDFWKIWEERSKK